MAKISQEQAIAELAGLIRRNKLIILVGAGVSVDSGLPTWTEFLRRLIDMCKKLPLPKPQKDDLCALLIDADKHLDRNPARVASTLKEKLRSVLKGNQSALNKYKNWLITEFATATPNEKHNIIVQTNYPFILTTNYDMLLEDAAAANQFFDLSNFTYTFKKGSALAGAIVRRQPSIIHIHGVVSDLDSGEIVFTQEDYRDMIKNRYEGFSFALRMLFFDYSVLYVGYGASDPHLEDIQQDITAYFPTDSGPVYLNSSYLILKEDKIDRVLVDHKDKLHTNLVPIQDFSQITTILAALRNAAPRPDDSNHDDLTLIAQPELPGL